MNTQNNEHEHDPAAQTPNSSTESERSGEPEARPLGYWLRTVDRLLAGEFARAFAGEDLTRRDWRLMNLLDGTVPGSGSSEHGRGSGHDFNRDHRGHRTKRLQRLAERGWITKIDGDWHLTDSGREVKERLAVEVANIRATVADAVGPDDYDTTVRALERIAVALGWDPEAPLPPKRGYGRKHPRWGSGRGGSWHDARGFEAGFANGRRF